jgi:hypothetical protein
VRAVSGCDRRHKRLYANDVHDARQTLFLASKVSIRRKLSIDRKGCGFRRRRIGEAQFLRGLPGTPISDFCVWIPTCPLVRPISQQFAVELLDRQLRLETARIVQDPNARCEVDDPPIVIGHKFARDSADQIPEPFALMRANVFVSGGNRRLPTIAGLCSVPRKTDVPIQKTVIISTC